MLYEALNMIKNKAAVYRKEATVHKSRLILSVLRKLVDTGHLCDVSESDRAVTVKLKYPYRTSTFKYLEAISKPSRIVYSSVRNLSLHMKDKRTIILSTNRGIMTHREALIANQGGVLLFKI